MVDYVIFPLVLSAKTTLLTDILTLLDRYGEGNSYLSISKLELSYFVIVPRDFNTAYTLFFDEN
jgi:hypothetical protein